MKLVVLDDPPNPDEYKYKNAPLTYSRDQYQWAQRVKNKIENASSQNDTPLSQPFVVTSYTTNTQLTGTSSGTDVSNFLCTLVAALISKGLIKVNTSTG